MADRDDRFAYMRLRGAPPTIPNKYPIARFTGGRSLYDVMKEPLNDRETPMQPRGNNMTNPYSNKRISHTVMGSVYDN